MIGLVAGRDFNADGTIEAATVREGDPAPDGSGPLAPARGIEIGHVFALGRKFAEALGLTVLDENGRQVTVTMGSYGLGVTRAVAAIAEIHHDDRGLAWPRAVAPFDVYLVQVGRGPEAADAVSVLVNDLEGAGLTVLLDDRPRVSVGVKLTDAELLGIPDIVVAGRGLATGTVEHLDRLTGARVEVALTDIGARLGALRTAPAAVQGRPPVEMNLTTAGEDAPG